MENFWLNKSETQKVVETVESVTRMYTDYFSNISKDFIGVDIFDYDDFNQDKSSKKNKNELHGINPLEILLNYNETFNRYNSMFDGLFKNAKTTFFLNYFNYTINVGNVLSEAKKNPLIPSFHIDILKNMYMNTSIDYVVDYLVQNTVQDFKLNNGSINDDIVDIVLNNVAKLTKMSYNFMPEIYDDMITKVIPGSFISSLLTYPDDRTEFEKALDMLITLDPITPLNFKSPITEDPFLNVLSILAPKQKKEKTIVETLADAVTKLDVSGYSKVKAADIIINRTSDVYEQQKKVANDFLESLISSIPFSGKKEEQQSKKKEQQPSTKTPDASASESPSKENVKTEKAKTGAKTKKAGVSESKGNMDENQSPDDVLVSIAGQILNGEWVNFDLIEKEIYRFLE